MDKISITFTNCHGIKKFHNDFEFKSDNPNKNCNLSLVYAPNGTMKTSFAKTLRDIGRGNKPKNLVTNEDPKFTIEIYENDEIIYLEDSKDVTDRIFVIESLKKDFDFNETAPLIFDKNLRDEYSEIFSELLTKKENFLKKIKDKTAIRIPRGQSLSYLENKFNEDLNNSLDMLDYLFSVIDQLEDTNDLDVDLIKYDTLFNKKVLKILEDEEFIENVDSFSKNLNKIFEKSEIFDKNYFTHNNASVLLNSIKKNNLFKAGHKIKFKSKEQLIDNTDDLEKLFNYQISRIFNDSKLETQFNKINKKFTNAETKKLQEIITNNKYLITKLNDVNNLKKEYWFSVLNSLKDDLDDLINEFETKKKTLEKIRKKAKEEETQWQNVIDIFNTRFRVPFTLKLENKEDVILNQDVPEITFYYELNNNEKKIPLETLKEISSSGQLRALYLLDIIYQIEVRKNKNLSTLLVMDDIADSFDYQNKYAIIEYLNDLFLDESFRIILLTHNYDFFRTVKSRLNCANCYFTIKNEHSTINLIKQDVEYGTNNLFSYFVQLINENPNEYIPEFISTIPFVRNLEEYKLKNNSDTYLKLTSLLHYTTDGVSIKPSNLKDIYDSWGIKLPGTSKTIYELIFEEANSIVEEKNITKIDMKNKLILSMAIRLKSEEFMFMKLKNFIDDDIEGNQTRYLLNKFKEYYSSKKEISILEKVVMMTPENIHLNSFMYEPILDMDDYYLKKLYKEILELKI